MQVRPYGTTYMPRLEMKRGTRNPDQGISAPTYIYQQEQGEAGVPGVTPGDARVVPDLYRATTRRRLTRAVAIAGEIVLAVMAAVAYGTLGAIVEVALDTARYVNAADHWRNGLVVFGVLALISWGRSAHRRWGAEPVPAMSDREADALAYIVTGLAEIEQHGLLRPAAPESRGVTQESGRWGQ